MANRIHLLIVICTISCWASSEGKPSNVLKAIEKDVDPSQSNSLEERIGGHPFKNAKKCGPCHGAEKCNKLGIKCCNKCEDLRRAYEDFPTSGPDAYDGCYWMPDMQKSFHKDKQAGKFGKWCPPGAEGEYACPMC